MGDLVTRRRRRSFTFELIASNRRWLALSDQTDTVSRGTNMAVATHSLTTMINAAFLQEVKESNVELWDTVHELRQMIEGVSSSSGNARRLVALLSQLRDLLAFEFSLEEAY